METRKPLPGKRKDDILPGVLNFAQEAWRQIFDAISPEGKPKRDAFSRGPSNQIFRMVCHANSSILPIWFVGLHWDGGDQAIKYHATGTIFALYEATISEFF